MVEKENKDLNKLSHNRDLLLSAEIAMWLHMLGKFNEKFLDDTSCATKIPDDLRAISPDLYKLLIKDWLDISLCDFDEIAELKNNFTIEQIIREHHNNRPKPNCGYLRLMIEAHGRGSSVEKGILRNGSYYGQTGDIAFASAFGYEDGFIDRDTIKKLRIDLYLFLERELKLLKNHIDKATDWNESQWFKWRLRFIKRLKNDFSMTVAETRKPVNDVSLWDQTMASVAFFKASLAEVLLKGKYKVPSADPNQDQYRWKTLRVALRGLEFISKPRIGAVLAYKGLIDKGFDNIRQLIEVEYPLGLEVYRDINSALFIVPDMTDILEYKCDGGNNLDTAIKDKFNESAQGEVIIDINLSDSSGRNIFFFGSELGKEIAPLSPTKGLLHEAWKISGEKCTMCQVRPQEKKVRKICGTCFERLKNRSENWITRKRNKTIWMNEISDINGKIALITARFNLDSWLDGEMISTFRNVKDSYDKTFDGIAEELKNKDYTTDLDSLSKFKEIAETHFKNIGNMKKIIFEGERYEGMPENEMLAMGVWRKPPSFARIQRVWGTTHAFWKRVSEELTNLADIVEQRVEIEGKFVPDADSNSAYKAKIKKILFDLYYDGNKCIVIENPQRLAKQLNESSLQQIDCNTSCKYIKETLENEKKITIISEESNSEIGYFEISNVTISHDLYRKIIPLLNEPQCFIALVPADSALKAAYTIKEMYQKQMSKVRNRLPLFLGIAFGKYNTPMNILLDISQRMVKCGWDDEPWRLSFISGSDGHYELKFENGVSWNIEDDIWHSNFYMDCTKELHNHNTAFRGPKGWLVNVRDLHDGDRVRVYPSLFDFEYVDASARRFEVSYEKGKRRAKTNKPYLLEELDDFMLIWNIFHDGLAGNQIRRVIELIETKRIEWQADKKDTVFLRFIKGVVTNAQWRNGIPEDIDNIVVMAASGKLKDIIELHS